MHLRWIISMWSMHWKQVQKQLKSKILMQMIPKPLLMIQYQLMRTLFPRLPQVHPMKRKNRTEKKCQKQLQEVQPESEQKHLMRKSKRKCRQKSIADLS